MVPARPATPPADRNRAENGEPTQVSHGNPREPCGNWNQSQTEIEIKLSGAGNELIIPNNGFTTLGHLYAFVFFLNDSYMLHMLFSTTHVVEQGANDAGTPKGKEPGVKYVNPESGNRTEPSNLSSGNRTHIKPNQTESKQNAHEPKRYETITKPFPATEAKLTSPIPATCL